MFKRVGIIFTVLLAANIAFGQVVVTDPSRNSALINSLGQSVKDAQNQGQILTTEQKLEEIRQGQIKALEDLLSSMNGSFDITSIENGDGDILPPDEIYGDEGNQHAEVIFDKGRENIESIIINAARETQDMSGVKEAGLNSLEWRLLVQSLIRQESAFNPTAKSHVGATGLAQIMPATGADIKSATGLDYKIPKQNAQAGAWYLAKRLDYHGGNIEHGLAAYNAGSGNVDKHGGIPPFEETQNYVRKITGYYNGYVETVTASDETGTISARVLASGQSALVNDALVGYNSGKARLLARSLERILALLKMDVPEEDFKAALDRNTAIKIERARIAALMLKQNAARAETKAVDGISIAQEKIDQMEFFGSVAR